MLDTEPVVRDRPDAIDPGRMRGLVEFNDVSFSYDGKRPAVRDLSFTALPGEPSRWSARPAPANRPRLRCCIAPSIRSRARSRSTAWTFADSTLAALRRNIGVVFQEALLFNRSIAENLRVGKPDATEQEMREACARAQALEFIERLPEGFEAPVGERGRVSGGERQRLSIARALLKNPPILILDEATSALDAVTEAKVQAALDEVMKGRTTFVIAHRLATVRNATRILLLEARPHHRIRQLRRAGPRWAAISPSSPRPSSWCPKRRSRYPRRRSNRSGSVAGETLTRAYLIRSRMLT